ncbi:hypothetical protein BDZ89DRAFT_1161378 [Hymenopellis radicata]|nr:hypothetical protein BDZ89DRAFT_1161378 [Hymenopellis radicata]
MAFLSSSINPTYGFHPTLTVAFRFEDGLDCSLHLLLTLPPLVFVDPYELGNYKAQYTFQHAGPSNLELPVVAVGDEPSYVLFNVSRSARASGFAQIPLHLRYGEVGVEEFQSVNIPSPEAFLSCSASSGTSLLKDFTAIPPDFAPLFLSTNIYRVPSSEDVFQFNVPVGQIQDIPQVEAGTALTIILCCAYLIYVSCKTALRLRTDSNSHLKTS